MPNTADLWAFQPELFAFAKRKGHPSPEDAAQDALVTAIERFSDYDESRGSLKTWLLSILRGQLSNARRVRENRARLERLWLSEAPCCRLSPEEHMDARTAVDALTEAERAAVLSDARENRNTRSRVLRRMRQNQPVTTSTMRDDCDD